MSDLFRLGLKALIKNSRGDVLILRVDKAHRIKQKVKTDDNTPQEYWDFPGGQIDPGESIEQALKREVLEEIGVSNLKIIEFYTATLTKLRIGEKDNNVGLIIFAYLCEIPNDSKIRLSDEHPEYKWVKPKEFNTLLTTKYDQEFIQKIQELKF